MKTASQKNEIAGSAAQKLPGHAAGAVSAAGATEADVPEAKTRIPSDFPAPKDSSAPWMVIDANASGATGPTATTNVAGGPSSAAVHLDQVERLITREVVMVRQSGAEALAVSLKVDARTSLFLQLTNHHGQIEASVRCESGDPRALDAHWGQLQESLARQNVQLMPLENNLPSSSPSFDAPPDTAKSFPDGPPSQNQPPPGASDKETPSDDAMNAAVGLTKSKNKPRHHHGWEKWA